jgi:hypothetical protein
MMTPPNGYVYDESGSGLSGAISDAMNFGIRVLEHEMVHYGAMSDAVSKGDLSILQSNVDAVMIGVAGVPVAVERGSLYEYSAYGNVGNTTNAGYAIYRYYAMTQYGGGSPAEHSALVQRAVEFKMRKTK